jgi:nitrite reductase (NO-forming)
LIYVFLFIALILLDYALGRSPYSVDFYIERSNPRWRKMAEWAPTFLLEQEPPYLSWAIQFVTITGLIVMFIVFVTILTSELGSSPASSASALEWFKLSFTTTNLTQIIQLI